MRIGQGYDVHRLAPSRKLILGGVDVPFDRGLDGHSDADVLTHAIMDAILGAIGERDIGTHFPDTDDKYRQADSLGLLAEVGRLMRNKGYILENVDATIICQKPKLAPLLGCMIDNIATSLRVENDRINLKATTTEKLGFEGREEGISALAVCLLNKRD